MVASQPQRLSARDGRGCRLRHLPKPDPRSDGPTPHPPTRKRLVRRGSQQEPDNHSGRFERVTSRALLAAAYLLGPEGPWRNPAPVGRGVELRPEQQVAHCWRPSRPHHCAIPIRRARLRAERSLDLQSSQSRKSQRWLNEVQQAAQSLKCSS